MRNDCSIFSAGNVFFAIEKVFENNSAFSVILHNSEIYWKIDIVPRVC